MKYINLLLIFPLFHILSVFYVFLLLQLLLRKFGNFLKTNITNMAKKTCSTEKNVLQAKFNPHDLSLSQFAWVCGLDKLVQIDLIRCIFFKNYIFYLNFFAFFVGVFLKDTPRTIQSNRQTTQTGNRRVCTQLLRTVPLTAALRRTDADTMD